MLTYFKLARILFWKLLIDLLISYFLCEKGHNNSLREYSV